MLLNYRDTETPTSSSCDTVFLQKCIKRLWDSVTPDSTVVLASVEPEPGVSQQALEHAQILKDVYNIEVR